MSTYKTRRAPIVRMVRELLFIAGVWLVVLSAARADEPALTEADWIKTLQLMPSGGWEWLTQAEGVQVFVSYRNTIREGNIVTVWQRWEYSHTVDGYHKSIAERTQVDCVQVATRTLSQSLYPLNNLGGDPQEITPEKTSPWKPQVPGTIGELVVSTVCAHTRPHTPKTKPN